MSIEKIERVREVMSWLDGWDGNRSAASFKGFQSVTLGDIRALLDELSRLREVERRAKEVIGPAFVRKLETYLSIYSGDKELAGMLAAARALSEREGQDG